MAIGRNDPCPCGSGIKYKKCCLSKAEPTSDELFWQRMHAARNDLIKIILKHAKATYGEMVLDEAWHEFHLWDEDETVFDPDSFELPIFMPWFFYSWFPDEEDSDLNPTAPLDMSPAESLLASRSSRLEPLQAAYVEECLSKGFSFIELLEVWPGQGFKAVDVLTGEIHDIIEKRGSEVAEPNDIMFSQVVTINGLTTLEASSSFKIGPIFKPQIIALRQRLTENSGEITHEVLREFTLEIVEVYQDIRMRIFNRQPPVLKNTDGHELAPHKLSYDIESPSVAFEALHELSAGNTKAELLEMAEMGNDGSLKKVNFPWLMLGNKQHKGWDNTVLGHIAIDGHRMTVEVNSVERAEKFEEEVNRRLAGGCKLKSKVIEPLEAAIKKMKGKPESESQSHEDLNNDPQVQALLAEMNRRHWESWISDKIPALGDKTPLEALKSADGREALDALLNQFERDATTRPMPGQTEKTFQDLRERLGL